MPLRQFDQADGPASGAIAVRRRTASGILAPHRAVGRASIAAHGVRFYCDDEVTFDIENGAAIGWVPGPAWHGALPVSFYSSVAAITLAMRGMLPLHASAVVLHNKAWLIAGPSGAGKSTLTAELIMAGALLLADDLTPLTLAPGPVAWRGRPAMRLHPASCEGLAIDGAPEPTDDGRGKLLVRPSLRAADTGWPVGGIVLLGDAIGAGPGPEYRALAYGSILFRPRILTALPGRAQTRENLLALARTVPMALLPQVQGFNVDAKDRRTVRALAMIERLASSGQQR